MDRDALKSAILEVSRRTSVKELRHTDEENQDLSLRYSTEAISVTVIPC